MARSDAWDDDRRSGRRRRPDGDRHQTPDDHRSTAVSLLGVFNILVGGLVLIGGMCGLLVVSAFGSDRQLSGLGLPGIGGGITLSLMVVLAIFVWGVGAIVAGIGLIRRARWARMWTLLIAAFSATVGLLYLVASVLVLWVGVAGQEGQAMSFMTSFIGALLFLGHCLWSYLVLLRPKYVDEFR